MIRVRGMKRVDVPACTAIVNHIIALGGSTAYEDPFSEDAFSDHYLDEAPVTNVALLGTRVVGFQGAFDVGDDVLSIGSFTDRLNPVKGAGRALFAKTLADSRAFGAKEIIAKITSDNTGGLAFYSRLGFVDHEVWKDDFTRADGAKVDRVIKRYTL
ncbi:GNAT family N-acetyltransferase [Thalassococcus lentus]|uniref:GNAT family N-acetyltransferase n=1 Tax=Thalassococcus lentus TaxID=1210524 RepID=A0ABT4XNE6_9RHOB|nr:GNAT family N-acetyltransferase [Thalassococcus lentus]MDA7423464.1 GNAT family N-acetyltransferase [Thalassococcus lentus]